MSVIELSWTAEKVPLGQKKVALGQILGNTLSKALYTQQVLSESKIAVLTL